MHIHALTNTTHSHTPYTPHSQRYTPHIPHSHRYNISIYSIYTDYSHTYTTHISYTTHTLHSHRYTPHIHTPHSHRFNTHTHTHIPCPRDPGHLSRGINTPSPTPSK